MTTNSIPKTLERMDEIIIKAMNASTLPGLAVGVIHNGDLVYSKGFGFANIQQDIPVTPETVFRIGSISKTFTAIGLMQLYEQGKFKLDDPVNQYLKSYRIQHRDPGAPPVTFRHLLTHTSGIGEVLSLMDVFKPAAGLGAKPDTPQTPLSEYYRGALVTEVYPGEKWAYGNHAYATLGQLVEDISGEPFADYMLAHVFQPLGMQKTDYLLRERVQGDLAQGYNFKKGEFRPVEYLRIEIPGAGSIFSTLNDMASYVQALLNGGRNSSGAVLQPDTLAMMMSPQLDFDPRVFGMGFAFILSQVGEHRIVWHNGGWPGFVSAMYLAPDDQLGVLVFTNASNPAPDKIALELLHEMLDVPQPAAGLPKPGILEAPHLWKELSGFYGPQKGFFTNARVWMGMGGELEVTVRGSTLTLRSLAGGLAKGLPLYRQDQNDPLIYSGTLDNTQMTVLFQRNQAGVVDRLQVGPNIFYKRPLAQSLRFRILSTLGTAAALALIGFFTRKRKKSIRD